MRSSFVFGHKGKPSLSHTVCSRSPLFRKEPGRTWFKTLQDFPYGGWGFYSRLHCHVELSLTPVFNYWITEAAHQLHANDDGEITSLKSEFSFLQANRTQYYAGSSRQH